jgi:hypothetical protein
MPQTVEKFIPEVHYSDVSTWWQGHGWPIIPMNLLPSRGFIVPGLAAGFLYSTDSSLAWMEWIVGNPHASAKQVYVAIKNIVEKISDTATEDGFDTVFTAIRQTGLEKLYSKVGFITTDTDMKLMVWRK